MADSNKNVKPYSSALARFVDDHPRTGWYIALLMTLNTVLNMAALLVH